MWATDERLKVDIMALQLCRDVGVIKTFLSPLPIPKWPYNRVQAKCAGGEPYVDLNPTRGARGPGRPARA